MRSMSGLTTISSARSGTGGGEGMRDGVGLTDWIVTDTNPAPHERRSTEDEARSCESAASAPASCSS